MRADRRWRRGLQFALRVSLLLSAAIVATAASVDAQARDTVSHSGAHRMGWGRETFVLTEVLEFDPDASERPVAFDIVGWTGGASRRLWFKADGGVATVGRAMHGEYQLLAGRMISPWWDVQAGLRHDRQREGTASVSRTGAVVGLQGLAPGWFEVEPSLFVTSDGHVSADLTASFDLYLTQRLVLQPRLEASAAVRDEARFGIGRGLSAASFGLRTRYEFRREFAPYAGVVWEGQYGRTRELARLGGEGAGGAAVVAGLRVWY